MFMLIISTSYAGTIFYNFVKSINRFFLQFC